jgi:hypothetical protein
MWTAMAMRTTTTLRTLVGFVLSSVLKSNLPLVGVLYLKGEKE